MAGADHDDPADAVGGGVGESEEAMEVPRAQPAGETDEEARAGEHERERRIQVGEHRRGGGRGEHHPERVAAPARRREHVDGEQRQRFRELVPGRARAGDGEHECDEEADDRHDEQADPGEEHRDQPGAGVVTARRVVGERGAGLEALDARRCVRRRRARDRDAVLVHRRAVALGARGSGADDDHGESDQPLAHGRATPNPPRKLPILVSACHLAPTFRNPLVIQPLDASGFLS
ncbi:MAG: hypothetical protein KIT31_15300 [Deltaproteobacteria bacterium]|nr:hypothetical protein [Deltaproteobacteria bacterium]